MSFRHQVKFVINWDEVLPSELVVELHLGNIAFHNLLFNGILSRFSGFKGQVEGWPWTEVDKSSKYRDAWSMVRSIARIWTQNPQNWKSSWISWQSTTFYNAPTVKSEALQLWGMSRWQSVVGPIDVPDLLLGGCLEDSRRGPRWSNCIYIYRILITCLQLCLYTTDEYGWHMTWYISHAGYYMVQCYIHVNACYIVTPYTSRMCALGLWFQPNPRKSQAAR